MMMTKITSLAVAVLVVLVAVATRSHALPLPTAPITGNMIGQIHVRNFEIWDDFGFGFTFGRYESGLPDCVVVVIDPETFDVDCFTNGYVRTDISVPPPPGESGITAVYYFYGPAFDLNGVAIPGTEDDFVRVSAKFDLKAVFLFADFHLILRSILVEGSSLGDNVPLEFANGVSVEGLRIDFAFSDDQRFGSINPYFSNPGDPWFSGSVFGASTPSTMLIDPFFGIHYQQQTERFPNIQPMVNVPVPEPSMALSVVACFGLLLVLDRARGGWNNERP